MRFYCVFFLFLFLSSSIYSQDKTYTIKGKIISSDPQIVVDVPVVLLQLKQEGTSENFSPPIQRTKTDENGNYSFTNIQSEENSLYGIGTLIQGQRIGSEMIPLKDKLVEILDIVLPSISYEVEKLEISSNLIVLNLLPEKIRITEVINVNNPLKEKIDNNQKPLSKILPPNASNFQLFQVKNEVITTETQDNQVDFRFQLEPGNHNIFFEYDLPFVDGYVSFLHKIVSGAQKLSIIYHQEYLKLTIPDHFIAFEKNQFGQRADYLAGDLKLTPQISTIELNIQRKITSQKTIYFLVASLIIMMIISAIFYFFQSLRSSNSNQ